MTLVDARPGTGASTRSLAGIRISWLHNLRGIVIALDCCAAALAGVLAWWWRFGDTTDSSLHLQSTTVPYVALVPLAGIAWIAVVAACDGYEGRAIGSASEQQYRRVLHAGVLYFALIASLFFLFRVSFARGFVAALVPSLMLFTLMSRYIVRRVLTRRRARGLDLFRVVAVGSRSHVQQLAEHLHRSPASGYRVVGATFTAGETVPLGARGLRIEHIGEADDLTRVLAEAEATVVAVAGAGAMPRGLLRKIAWELEGTGVDLLVAPDIVDIAGPRIRSHPVAGLPLLHVDEPRLSVPATIVKAVWDRTVAVGGLIVLSPLFAVLALLIKVSSPGTVLFRQTRIGKDGKPFKLYKFRSMVAEAEEMLPGLAGKSTGAGAMFKIRNDPRVTKIGRFLRRTSLDELPQLLNVANGTMSLVGPRPPLPDELIEWHDDVHRRLLVKPGLTGLWQVSGRSDLDWDESIRLDLYYVDNWSYAMDLTILAKTAAAVARGDGAY
jgi:exopolysaccharide biosynthesis polyprenyl glycosylphosphotransferase